MKKAFWSAMMAVGFAIPSSCTCGENPSSGLPVDDGGLYGIDQRPQNLTCTAPARPASGSSVKLTRLFPRITFSSPMDVQMLAGDDGRVFVAERAGKISVFPNIDDPDPASVSTFLQLSSVYTAGEGGLLGFAFHPNFNTNHQFFVSYTKTVAGTLTYVLSRWTANAANTAINAGSEDPLLSFSSAPNDNHNGGTLHFGPDGFLYVGLGDSGGQDDPNNWAQNKTQLWGKMLRIDVDGTASPLPYRIPSTNPFASSSGSERKEIYALGFRNPWRWSFDRLTGELWAGDVGGSVTEEVNRVQLGGNYGWDIMEGTGCHEPTSGCAQAGLIPPIVEYPHDGTNFGGYAVIGGFVYRGSAIPSLQGKFVFGDYVSKHIWNVGHDPVSGAATMELLLANTGLDIAGFGEADNGELWVVNLSGTIHRLEPAAAAVSNTFPQTLSQTGCFDEANIQKPRPGLIPYGVNAALWSDGATKERFFALPDGTTVSVGAHGDFDFPIGSVLVKTFLVEGMRVETRLLVRHADGDWAGYTYEWNDAQTDATLLAGSKEKRVGSVQWHFPSQSECLQCHTQAAGRSLGLEVAQQNGNYLYPSGRSRNQLATLSALGFFAEPLSDPALLPHLSGYDSGSNEDQARSYLHANCSMCHRPSGGGGGSADYRFDTAFSDMQVCNATASSGDLGVSGAKLFVPTDPSKSVISLRIGRRDAYQMPPLATHVVDAHGAALVNDWISSVTSCP